MPTDLTRYAKNAEKKTYSVASANMTHDKIPDTGNVILFNLPPNSLITARHFIINSAGQANLTVDVGFDGGNELGNDLDIDATGVLTSAALGILTGTGKAVTAKFSADPSAGDFELVVEYIEYKLGSGNLMNYTA